MKQEASALAKGRTFPTRLRKGDDALLTTRDAAAMIGMSPSYVKNNLPQLFPTCVRFSRRAVRIRLTDVLALIERRTGPTGKRNEALPLHKRRSDVMHIVPEETVP
jgi:hypothetical protein